MRHDINPGRFTRSFAIGFIILLFSTSLVACGPGPEESTAPGSQSFAQGEPIFELAPDEREHEPIRSTQ